MLFVLTGDVQIGKSRWLESLAADLSAEGIESYGVISAGIWVESSTEHANEDGFEKLGIDSILLPTQERFVFAKRLDLAKDAGSYDAESQAGKANLGWHISDEALARVNAHFASLAVKDVLPTIRGLLIVDELGRLEIDHDQGLVEAVKLLDQGPTPSFPHALVVARSSLADRVITRFQEAWGDVMKIAPSEDSESFILKAFQEG